MASRDTPREGSSTPTDRPEEVDSSPHSLHHAVHARRSEFTRKHRIRIKVGTWNVAALPGTMHDLASWFISGKGFDKKHSTLDLHANRAIEREDTKTSSQLDEGADAVRLVGGSKVGLYVLGLQEVVSLGPTQYLTRAVADDHTKSKWRTALQDALPEGYQLVSCEQMSGLLMLIYASADVAATISNVSTHCTGTGVGGYFGNKGAVATRLVLGETTKMVFVNCHLASGTDSSSAQRRAWDVNHILASTKFAPLSFSGVSEDDSHSIGDEEIAFWFGDLNFRLDGIPGDDIRRILTLHTRGEYDVSKKEDADKLDGEGVVVHKRPSNSSDETTDHASTNTSQSTDTGDDTSISLPDPDEFETVATDDPASLQSTINSLLPHDQLTRMMKDRLVFHDGWREGPITFLPSYKYDVGTVALFDSSEKRRAPSWCDRILYRTRTDRDRYARQIKDEEDTRKKDEEMKARGMEHAGDDDEVLFDYDPDNDADVQPQGKAGYDYDEYDEDDDDDGDQVVTDQGFVDHVSLDIYTSQQRIMSSDHKPVISVFSLDYDAIVPELKAKVHAEVAWELDRAENEGRPGITIVVDGRDSDKAGSDGSDHAVDFGQVRFLRRESATLTIANTGRVTAYISFVEKSTAEGPGPAQSMPWLATSFARSDEGTNADDFGKEVKLEPGETVKAFLEVSIRDLKYVRELNARQTGLEEVLILRVADGRDHFIPVRATWSPTCIGRSIDELIRVPEGGIEAFAKAQAEAVDKPMGSIPYSSDVHFAAPKELFKLTEAVETLTERALADEQMLDNSSVPTEAGWPFDEQTWCADDKESRQSHVLRIIELLDTDKPLVDAFDPSTRSIARLEATAEVLLLFLDSLTDGVITAPLWARIETAPLAALGSHMLAHSTAADDDDRAAVLDLLSTAPNHNIAFVFLTTTLAKILAELAPLGPVDVEALKMSALARVPGMAMGRARRSLSFRRSAGASSPPAAAGLERRLAKEKRFAEVFGRVVCRAAVPAKDKEKKALDEKRKALLELFLRRREDLE